MKKLWLFVILTLCLTFVSAEFPEPRDKYVNDFAGILDETSSAQLHELFQIVDEETTAEVVFVSMETVDGQDLSQYATELGQIWGVGKSDKDNGIVILYVSDVNKIWVAVGYGVEGILPDSKIGRLLDEYYVPARDTGNITEGIISFSVALAEILVENKEEILSNQTSGDNSADHIWVIIAIVITVILILRLIARYAGPSVWWAPVFLPQGRSSGGSSFGGGGSGFGGGGFGGGGAGR